MADLDDLINQIPVADIASKLGADEGEVNSAIKTLVPALVGGIQQNVEADDIDSSELESPSPRQGASGLLDGGVSVDQVDEQEGEHDVATIFGGNDTSQVAVGTVERGRGQQRPDAEAAADPGADRVGLHRQAAAAGLLHPRRSSPAVRRRDRRHPGQHPRRRVAGGDNPLGDILGSVLGGKGGSIGDILGGLIRGRQVAAFAACRPRLPRIDR